MYIYLEARILNAISYYILPKAMHSLIELGKLYAYNNRMTAYSEMILVQHIHGITLGQYLWFDGSKDNKS